MSRQITSLGYYPSMRLAFDERTRLINAFLKAHKRAEKVDLFLAAGGTANPTEAEIRIYWTKETQAEKDWIVAAAQGGAK